MLHDRFQPLHQPANDMVLHLRRQSLVISTGDLIFADQWTHAFRADSSANVSASIDAGEPVRALFRLVDDCANRGDPLNLLIAGLVDLLAEYVGVELVVA